MATNVKVLTEVMIAESIPSNEVFGFKNPEVSFQTESVEDKHQIMIAVL